MESDSEISGARYFRESHPISYRFHTTGAGIGLAVVFLIVLSTEMYVLMTATSVDAFVVISGVIGLVLCVVAAVLSNSLRQSLIKAELKLSTEV